MATNVTNGRLRSGLSPLTASRKKDHIRSAQQARSIKPGFPFPRPLSSREEVDEYFSHDLIQCLLCGKSYGRLTSHLRVHVRCNDVSWDTDSYKKHFGLPWCRGLTGKLTHAAYVAMGMQRPSAERWLPETRGAPAGHIKRRPPLYMTTERVEHAERVRKLNPHPSAKLNGAAVRAIRADMRTLVAIAADYGVTFQTISDIRLGKRWKTSEELTKFKRHGTKLDEAAVRAIRADTRKLKAVAADYGVSESRISTIRNGKSWTTVL